MTRAVRLFALAAALSNQVAGQAPNPPSRAAQWEEDLQLFAKQFPASHIDFAKRYVPAAFDGELAALRANIASLTDAQITLRLMKLVASAHVAPTYVGAPRLQPFHRLPLALAWYADGPAVIGASSEYAAAIGTHASASDPRHRSNCCSPWPPTCPTRLMPDCASALPTA